jgi:hypothetical protein
MNTVVTNSLDLDLLANSWKSCVFTSLGEVGNSEKITIYKPIYLMTKLSKKEVQILTSIFAFQGNTSLHECRNQTSHDNVLSTLRHGDGRVTSMVLHLIPYSIVGELSPMLILAKRWEILENNCLLLQFIKQQLFIH